MAELYAIADRQFDIWRGDEPDIPGKVIVSHTRPGTDGTAQKNLGTKGRQFTAEVDTWVASLAIAKSLSVNYKLLLGDTHVLVYEGIDYSQTFNLLYTVDTVVEINARTVVRLLSATKNLAPGVILTTRIQMTPV